ncbi:hypothetical protein [Bacteroides ovatus]|uniref:hypothetical protein n=1 Tax=Bacteroides ovatus TaxID=28116 RepID=UPI00203063AB|nr:hypothetical protein [Bacteroides ovatus]MCM1722612.1 hypothetical protein [Bacteroides ovatus]MCM1758989.1 hypothetical protein [Bacteroides ovatus]MCM1869044.1 hypothetical protein [Bacteroides ovatus]MCM1912445.1 hypothetical protein [Bacteroides ovatus]
MKRYVPHIFYTRYKGTTLPEILIVIILSGLLFLILFEGMNIVNRYNSMLKDRLIKKNELFYSHSTLELIMEETDSIRKAKEDDILLFYKAGEIRNTILLKNEGFQVLFKELQDTIFINNLDWEFRYIDEEKHEIDSIIVIVPIDNDTLTLKYGLSSMYHLIKNNR